VEMSNRQFLIGDCDYRTRSRTSRKWNQICFYLCTYMNGFCDRVGIIFHKSYYTGFQVAPGKSVEDNNAN
jgi:hypothetical protein